MDETVTALRIVRRLLATPDEVFDAWTDADSIRQWMCPGETRVTVAEIDARVGGRFRIVMSTGDWHMEHTGEYLEVRRSERLVFTWRSSTTRDRETVVTVELRPVGNETELILVHERFPDGESRAKHQDGWTAIVEKLTEKLAAHLGHGGD
ncbi:MAG TPA: SRPBCC domain-containing protein [Candidatus Binatia bacterium]|nr:SRPBCC domain-containing protein [Candidatus Binatia bacterium]